MDRKTFLQIQLKGQEEAATYAWKLAQLNKSVNNFEGSEAELEFLLEQQVDTLEKLIDLYSDRIGLILKYIPD